MVAGAGHSGVGKSPAYKVGFKLPVMEVEQRNSIKLTMRKFTSAAFYKIQEDSKGNGIISSDEIAQTILAMLKRSEESGEREDL